MQVFVLDITHFYASIKRPKNGWQFDLRPIGIIDRDGWRDMREVSDNPIVDVATALDMIRCCLIENDPCEIRVDERVRMCFLDDFAFAEKYLSHSACE